jgi:hypothetical protein
MVVTALYTPLPGVCASKTGAASARPAPALSSAFAFRFFASRAHHVWFYRSTADHVPGRQDRASRDGRRGRGREGRRLAPRTPWIQVRVPTRLYFPGPVLARVQ